MTLFSILPPDGAKPDAARPRASTAYRGLTGAFCRRVGGLDSRS